MTEALVRASSSSTSPHSLPPALTASQPCLAQTNSLADMEHIVPSSPGPVAVMGGQQSASGGTGGRFARAVTIVAGVAALVATILTFV